MHMKHKEKMLMSIPEAKVCLHKAFLNNFKQKPFFLKTAVSLPKYFFNHL